MASPIWLKGEMPARLSRLCGAVAVGGQRGTLLDSRLSSRLDARLEDLETEDEDEKS
jgi:hypothetical protein